MQFFQYTRKFILNPLWVLVALVAVIVACGGDDATATPEAEAPAAQPTTAAAAPAATTAPAAEDPQATEAPVAEAEATEEPEATTRAPGARPEVQATPTPVPTAAPTEVMEPEAGVQAKITRVSMANPLPLTESNRIWSAAWSILIQHDPYGETLIENDPVSAEPTPALAESWEVTPDFKTWKFHLREGIPWHFDFGEFTAADVEHTYDLIVREDGGSNFKAIWNQFTPNVIDDHTIEFTHEKFFVDGGRLFSRLQGDLVIQSKAQWDAAGGADDAYDERPAGTGSYQYGGRVSGQSQWFEKIDYEHWAGEDPDFQELEWVWSSEEQTRLSKLLAKEVQGADLSRDVRVTAIDRGMTVVSSNNENNQSYGFFGGTYLSTFDSNLEPWPGGQNPYYTGPEPWHDVRVREAFNRAVDRDAIVDSIYFGNASPVYVPVYAPFTEGWNDRWVSDFDDKYGYDPDRAVELLAEAGYGPGDLSIGMLSTVIPGNPEIPQLIEALSVMWEAIGVNTSITDMEQGAWLDKVRAHDIHETFTILRNTPIRTTQEGLRVFWVSEPDGFLFGWENDLVNEKYDCLESSLDADEREQCARDAGDFMFDDYATLPLFQTTFDMTVDPEFIAGWVYPGVGSAHPTHVHLIEACPEGTDRCE